MDVPSQGLRPNPAPHELVVAFTVASAEPVQLSLYDVRGRVVLARRHAIEHPGWHAVAIGDARDVPAGVYFLRLTQGLRSLTNRACVFR